jgi:hypothetical protein
MPTLKSVACGSLAGAGRGGGLGGGGGGSGSGPRGPRLAATLLAVLPLSFTSASSACTWLDTFYVYG